MADFKNIPSQFDEIPEGHPVVFISYSWDSEEHKAWVKKLSDDLRSKYAVYTLLDRYNRGGGGSFGRAGSRAIGNVIQFVSDVKSLGIGGAIDALCLAPNDKPQTPRELIKTLCVITAEGGDALHDDEAAVNAQDWLLSKIFEECSSLGDVETILQQADEDTIDAWIIDLNNGFALN